MYKRVSVVAALVEGNSIRSTERMVGVSRPTILKLLTDLGSACTAYQDAHVCVLRTKRVQCDEIWSFCYSKQSNTTFDVRQREPNAGDVWTWVALDADSKLCITWRVGSRQSEYAHELMADVASRMTGRVQVTTDQYRPYLKAVEDAFGADADYAMAQKTFRGDTEAQRRYSPAKIVSMTTEVIKGRPDLNHISTSYVERQNLTMRMSMRRFTRLTNGFSKKLENHMAAVALHFMHYNFARIHKTLRVTPAMAAGVADHVWGLDEIVGLLDAADKKAA